MPFSNQAKNTSVFSVQSENASSFSILSKALSSFSALVKRMRGFLLKEDGFHLLLETGYKIIIEPDASQVDPLTKDTNTFSNATKH